MKNSTNVGTKKPIWKRWWFISVAIIVGLFVIIIAIGSSSPGMTSNTGELKYEVVEKTDQSRTSNEKRFEVKVVTSSVTNKDQIEPMFNKIVSDFNKTNEGTTELWIYLYTSKDAMNSGTSYDIASVRTV
jgi:hypothetical protein